MEDTCGHINSFIDSSLSGCALEEKHKLIMKQINSRRISFDESPPMKRRVTNEPNNTNPLDPCLAWCYDTEGHSGKVCRKALERCLQKRVSIEAGGNALRGWSSMYTRRIRPCRRVVTGTCADGIWHACARQPVADQTCRAQSTCRQHRSQ